MTPELALEGSGFESRAVSPFREMGAYEALWARPGATFKSLSAKFASCPGSIPSDFVPPTEAADCARFVKRRFKEAGVGSFGVRVLGAGEYPARLQDAARPAVLLYYQGWWDLSASRSIAVVGTRKPSPEGLTRTRRIVRELTSGGFTVVSGLAKGIDTAAHNAAIECNGRTIAVLGTPLSHVYPRENSDLQRRIAKDFLVVTQVPVKRYESQDYRFNRAFFPERNVTMSALTEATIIVEAGDTSGTLVQARAALRQGRKLFILKSCFRNSQLAWTDKFARQGAIIVSDYSDITQHLTATLH